MLLALDTATTTASIALYDLDTDQLLAELTWQARRRQTQELTPAIQDLLARMDLTPADITALAATTGPGSFTGVRIAISTAKGIALGLPALPTLIGLPTLSVTAGPWVDVAAKLRPAPRIVACIQAGRGRYNWAEFSPAHPLHRPGVDDHGAGRAADFVAALAAMTDPVWLVGEVDDDLGRRVGRAGPCADRGQHASVCAGPGIWPAWPPCIWPPVTKTIWPLSSPSICRPLDRFHAQILSQRPSARAI